jgi:capsular exopolysaccharide synthesis family protein
MGKIHKALEKSKKEQQQSQKNPFGSLKTQLKDRRRSKVIVGKDREKRNLKTTADSKLAAIHALLDDTAKTKTTTPDARSLREPVQAPDDIRSDNRDQIPEVIDKIKPEREVDPVVSKKKRYEPPRPKPSIEKNVGRHDEAVSVATSPEPQDVVVQKIVSLKSTPKLETTVQYIQDDDYAPPSGHSGPSQPQTETGENVRLHYSLVTLSKPKSFEAEQFKILRANILFPKSGPPPKTILLTSAVPGEGKTFTAMNLAVSLAQNLNSHVLLVDADIRKPEIHKRFGLGENIHGLSDYLTQNVPISSLLVKSPLSNLTILPGGQATINPSELISSEKMKKLLTELSTRYSDRFVVIDAPPPKLAAETYALARYVEHIIPVVRSGRSNRELVEEMMNLLGRDKIQGVVFNWYDIRKTKRFGYHKYSEYYSQ